MSGKAKCAQDAGQLKIWLEENGSSGHATWYPEKSEIEKHIESQKMYRADYIKLKEELKKFDLDINKINS